jgi:hypothetical protein
VIPFARLLAETHLPIVLTILVTLSTLSLPLRPSTVRTTSYVFRLMISLDRGRVVGYTETPPRVRFRSETYAAEWMSSLRNRIESNCKFGTYRASATKLFLLQLVLLTCSDPNFDTPYLTVTRTCPTRPL